MLLGENISFFFFFFSFLGFFENISVMRKNRGGGGVSYLRFVEVFK